MDFAMLLGATLIALANGLDDEGRDRAFDMLSYFSDRETFSPAEQEVLRAMVNMATKAFADLPKVPPLRLVEGGTLQ